MAPSALPLIDETMLLQSKTLSMNAELYRRPSSTQAAADAIPILVDGTYHLFHLTTPPNTIHHPQRLRSAWSHLKSVCSMLKLLHFYNLISYSDILSHQ